MTYQELKQIEITGFLSQQGFQPVKQTQNDAWYLSPYRNEKTPSFKVNKNRNCWYDYGESRGGDVIRLASIIWNASEKDTVNRLIALFGPGYIHNHPVKTSAIPDNNEIIILKNCPITSLSLISYLKSRKIPLETAKPILREIHYRVGTYKNQYFALGLKNDKGGYDLKSSSKGKDYKRCKSPKFISTFPQPDSTELNLFEGMFDFLSAFVYYHHQPAHTSIVLNSVNQIEHVLPLLSHYKKINLYLDNDTAGRCATEKIMCAHPTCKNYSQLLYPGFKDFNEFLCGETT
jgi:hypothetical protein